MSFYDQQFLNTPCTDLDDAIDEMKIDIHDRSKPHICTHMFHDGSFCRDIAMAGQDYCRWHSTAADRERRQVQSDRKRRSNAIENLNIPTIEDAYSHQLAMQRVLDAILDGRLRGRDAGHVLYWLQISQHNIQGKLNIPRHKLNEQELEYRFREELRDKIHAERERLRVREEKRESKKLPKSEPAPAEKAKEEA